MRDLGRIPEGKDRPKEEQESGGGGLSERVSGGRWGALVGLAVLAALAVIVLVLVGQGGGDGDGVVVTLDSTLFPESTPQLNPEDLKLVQVAFVQEDGETTQTHYVHPDDLATPVEDLILTVGVREVAILEVTVRSSDGADLKDLVIGLKGKGAPTDHCGTARFSLPLDETGDEFNRTKVLTIQAAGEEVEFQVKLTERIANGGVTDKDTLNTGNEVLGSLGLVAEVTVAPGPTSTPAQEGDPCPELQVAAPDAEAGDTSEASATPPSTAIVVVQGTDTPPVPTTTQPPATLEPTAVPPEDEGVITVGWRIDPRLRDAFKEFCGFPLEQVADVGTELTKVPQRQVAWDEVNERFVPALGVVPPGQWVWVINSVDGEECFLNPPCGNPIVPEGKLPSGKPVSKEPGPREEVPLTTPTTPPPGTTPTPPATATPRPTATPPPQTPMPSFTPPPPCCPDAETTSPAEGDTPIAPTFTPRPTRTPLPQPTQDRPDPPVPTQVEIW